MRAGATDPGTHVPRVDAAVSRALTALFENTELGVISVDSEKFSNPGKGFGGSI